MNIKKLELFFLELARAPYVGEGKIEEQAILELARKHGIEEGIALPVKGTAATKKYTAIKFADGIRYIQGIELLNADIDNLKPKLFMTKDERKYLTDNQINSITELLNKVNLLDIAGHSPKLYAKLLPYIRGIYIRDAIGKIVCGVATINLPTDKVYIIRHPNGKQDSPDFVILWDNKCLALESKTTKIGKILWNSGYNSDGYLYSFVCPMLSHHLFFMGEDYADIETRRLLDRAREICETHPELQEINAKLKANSHINEYIELYPRPMHNAQPYHTSPNNVHNHNRATEKLMELGIDMSQLRIEK